MRKIITLMSIIAICAFIVPVNFAQSTQIDKAGINEKNPLTKNQLYNLSKKSNVGYIILNDEVNRAKKRYKNAMFISSAIQKDIDDPDEKVDFERRSYLGLKPLETKRDYLEKKYSILQLNNDLKIQSIDQYFTLFILENDLNLKRDYYEYMGKKNSTQKTKLKLGQITQLDKKIFENAYNRSFIEFSQAKNSYANQKRKLNIFIDRDPESPLYLKNQEISSLELKDIDLEEIMGKIIENSYRIKIIELKKEIAKVEKNLKSRFSGFGEVAIEMELLDDKMIELSAQIEDEKRKLKLELYSGYENAKIAVKNSEISNMEKDIAKKNYEIAKLQFENGILSVFDLSELYNKYEVAYYHAMKNELAQQITIMEFNDFISENTVDITD